MSEITKSEIYHMTKEQNYMRGYEDGRKDTRKKAYRQGRADALDIDMDKPMHFTDEQKAWVENYIIINAKRQRTDTIDECLRIITECSWKDANMLEDMIKELKHGNTGNN